MAKIRKIKEKELVGGTSNTEVYPITHIDAVYTSDNRKLTNIVEDINNTFAKTVYISESEYDSLKLQGLLKDDVEYNIFEDEGI